MRSLFAQSCSRHLPCALPLSALCAILLPSALYATTTTITSGSVYRIFDMNSGQVMEVPGSSTADQALIVQAPSNETNTQYWKVVSVASGVWKLVDVNSGKALSVLNGSTAAGTSLDQFTDNGSASQKWTISAVGDGSYKIINQVSSMLAQVAGGSQASHAQINQQVDNGTPAQHWAFEEVAAGGALPRVYIGGGDNAPGAFNGYLNDPTHWTYVRANADGYYINNFALNTNTGDSTQNSHLQTMAGLFTHHNVFYETDAARETGDNDKIKIDILRQFFNVSYATINEGSPADRVQDLMWREWRPVLVMAAPWELGGNMNNSSNATIQSEIQTTWGSTTDGPSGYFRDNTSGMQTGCYTTVQYTKSQGKLSELMIATYTSGTNSGTAAANGAAFLSAGQTMVRDCENNNASPDIWAISYYAAQLQVYAVTPESNSDGSAGKSVTGLGYWLIHHLRDPQHYARLEPVLSPEMTSGETLALPSAAKTSADELLAFEKATSVKKMEVTVDIPGDGSATQTVNYQLHNDSTWLDLCPLITAKLDDSAKHWKAHWTMDGRDVTEAMNAGGVTCVKELRLWPGETKEIQLTLSSDNANPNPVDVHVSLIPHPADPSVIRDQSVVRVKPVSTAARFAVAK